MQLMKIPGAGNGSPTDADWRKMGELCLGTTKQTVQPGEFKGDELSFMGLNNQNLHNFLFRGFLKPWEAYTGAKIKWIDLAQADYNARLQKSIATGVHFNLLGNIATLARDAFFWNALGNMAYHVLSVLVQYAIAFGLALLLNADIRGRKFFRVAFLLPFMLSPVAISWMVGKSIMEARFGPAATFARALGWSNPSFYGSAWVARASIMAMDAWNWISFLIILLLAGLLALSGEVMKSAKVDGANPWQSFWKIVFPLMLPVSVTAVISRIIFEFKLADLVIHVTAGGPGGATDTVSSAIYREYRDRSSVGYGTMLAKFYLILIIVFVTVRLSLASRWMRRVT